MNILKIKIINNIISSQKDIFDSFYTDFLNFYGNKIELPQKSTISLTTENSTTPNSMFFGTAG